MTKEQTIAETATAMQWFQEFNAFWVAGILPIVLAYFGWKTVKAKVDAENAKRRQEAIDHGEDEPGDKTVLAWARDQMMGK